MAESDKVERKKAKVEKKRKREQDGEVKQKKKKEKRAKIAAKAFSLLADEEGVDPTLSSLFAVKVSQMPCSMN